MTATCAGCGAKLPAGRLAVCPCCLFAPPEGTGGENTVAGGDTRAIDEPDPLVIGGNLVLGEEIGRGGMGTVFKAHHVRLGRSAAVKFLPESLADRPEFRTRFEREARALGMLTHPHIVTVYDFGMHGDRPYLVMEYVEGGSLAARLPLPPETAFAMLIDVCGALGYAHQKGIVHRDIKPSNLLLDEREQVKVSDFGLARFTSPEARGWTVTIADHAVGTPQYMAPEALAGAPPDPRMDLYSLGVVLHEMITGRLPTGDLDGMPPPWGPIIRKALERDPARRYGTAEEMRRDLESARLVKEAVPTAPLAPDEKNWIRAVALLLALATAAVLWAILECLTPKVIPADQVGPLVVGSVRKLSGGQVESLARFETGPVLAAVGCLAVALAGYGALRRHWTRAGLEVPEPDRPVPEARWVLRLGLLAIVLFGIRQALALAGFNWPAAYSPIYGGAIEVAALYCVWVTILECWRIRRPLRRERRLWLGLALSVLPPITVFLSYLSQPR